MTSFLAEQLSTAHWFDQRETREALRLGAAGVAGRGVRAPGGVVQPRVTAATRSAIGLSSKMSGSLRTTVDDPDTCTRPDRSADRSSSLPSHTWYIVDRSLSIVASMPNPGS